MSKWTSKTGLAVIVALNVGMLSGCGKERKGSQEEQQDVPKSIVVRIDQSSGKAERVYLTQGTQTISDSERQTFFEGLSGWQTIKEDEVTTQSNVDNAKEIPANSIRYVYDAKIARKNSSTSTTSSTSTSTSTTTTSASSAMNAMMAYSGRGGNGNCSPCNGGSCPPSGGGCYPGNSNYWYNQYPCGPSYCGYVQPYYPTYGYYHYPISTNYYLGYNYAPNYFFAPVYYNNYSYFPYQPFGYWPFGNFLYLWFYL